MTDIVTFFKENITIVISFITVIIVYKTYIINRRKHKFDRIEFENKKAKFSLYLENFFRTNVKEEKTKNLIFDIKITNFSSTKNSFAGFLELEYLNSSNEKIKIQLDHQPKLFDKEFHENLTKFPKDIRIDEKEIKSGWLIFNYPENLHNTKIENYKIIVKDGSNNSAHVNCNLIKDIIYGNKEN
ncbi:hypothetical protein [Flavobacterium sp. RS13.1]|uniref:hypothetical protein n=1 Tax=Flavobacterium sp. RS13.1 TaxID=3400345 RepID=UPI003AAADAEE